MKFRETKIFATLLLMACFLTPALPAYEAQPIAGQTPSGIPFSEMESRINALVAEHLGVTTPGVAIVVVYNGEIIFSRGYGYADIARRIPVKPETTVFELGSISKVFVWTAAMQLVEQGLLDLDADINTYLPEDARRQFAFEKPFTMRDLMNHSAGFGENLLDIFHDARTTESLMDLRAGLLLGQPAQIHEPGTIGAYSNFGSALAAYVIGHISGRNFAALERENIFIPSSMRDTLNQPDWLNNDNFLRSKAHGHIPDGRGGFRSSIRGFEEGIWVYIPMYPAGAVNGTAEDMARFIKALTPPPGESGPLFESVSTLAKLFSSSSLDPVNRPGTYHGFMRYNGALPSFGHAGGTASFSTNFVVVPQDRFGFVVLTNTVGEMPIVAGVTHLLLGNNFDTIQATTDYLPSAREVEGRFVMARRIERNFMELLNYLAFMFNVYATDDNTIRLDVGPIGIASFKQTEPHVFRMISIEQPGLMTITTDEIRFSMIDGKAAHMRIGNGNDLTALPPGRTISFLIMSAIIAASSILFFTLMPIILLTGYLRDRKKGIVHTRFSLLRTGFVLSTSLFVLNNLICVGRLVVNNFRSSAEMAPHIWINWIFAGLSVLLFCLSAIYFRAEKLNTRGKVFCGIAASFTVLLIFVLHNWNFFTFL